MSIQGVSGSQQSGVCSAQPVRQEREHQTVTEMIRESREKIEAHRKNLDKFQKETRNTNYGDAALEAYSRLGRAKNRSQVNAASGYARRRMAQLRAALRTDPDNAPAIRGAIRQLQKAVRRGEKKKRDLDREAVLERRQKRASEEEAARERQELRRRRVQRAIRESGYLREAEIDKRQNAQLTATRLELREQAQALGAAASRSLDSAIEQYAAQAAPEAPVETGGELDVQG